MTRIEAHDHIVNQSPQGISVHPPELTESPCGDVRTWCADIEDTDTGATGYATFDEHYGEIEYTWN